MNKCKKCGEEFPAHIRINGERKNVSRRKFCLDCSPWNKHNTRDITKSKTKVINCLLCTKEIEVDSWDKVRKFCSRKCSAQYEVARYIERWRAGLENGRSGYGIISKHIRNFLFRKFGNKCSKCGWSPKNPFTNKIPLTVHHEDGNWNNNKEENLDLLCPNCHSLTETYGSRNIGRGRKKV